MVKFADQFYFSKKSKGGHMMENYPTIYTDKSGRVITNTINSYAEKTTECLELIIDGIAFIGSGFDSLALKYPENYKADQLHRFTFNKLPLANSEEKIWELCNCKIEVHIRQTIIDTVKDAEFDADLKLVLHLGKPASNGGIRKTHGIFTLKTPTKNHISEADTFETALSQLQKEMLPDFRFKNCFSCHYSDYSPLGNGFFASMMCFRNNKLPYLTASKKEDYFKLATSGFIPVQETYHCNQFAPREKNTGYRGWPFE
jgi:hypothetical protein